ncbi:MAG: hypothetical protein EOP04_02140 [Proteobacteria bacterium]|nr:MAG: hypothetical protein EOP04_02140 [Pseudomonadota bacterium]
MKNSAQIKTALLCVLLMSNTLFASDQGALKFASTALSSKGPLKPAIGSGSSLPAIGLPRLTPDLTFGSGLKPKKISGTFGSPASELSKNNVSNAKAACIQDALSAGVQLPIADDSTVWEFATTSSQPAIEHLITPALKDTQSGFESSSAHPEAFSNDCADDIKAKACSSLMNKSMNEVTQAYYKSSLSVDKSGWDEVVAYLGLRPLDLPPGEHIDLVTALQKAQEKEDTNANLNGLNSFRTIENQDPLLLATKLIIQRIDESLARGDKEGADKATAILKKINPSAAFATTCVLSNAKNSGLNENLDPAGRPVGSFFGPLSGVDYSHDYSRSEIGGFAMLVFIVGTTLSIASLIQGWAANRAGDEKEKRDAEARRRSDAIAMANAKASRDIATVISINSFRACNGEKSCEALYPLGKEAIAAAAKKEEKAAGTAGPGRPVEDNGIKMDPFVITAPKPGSGGGGGELVPWEDAPLKFDYGEQLAKQKEAWKKADPKAAENFCAKTIKDYKAFGLRRLTSPGRPKESSPTSSSQPIPAGAFGVAQFDTWTASYWAEQKKIHLSNSANLAAENNCKSMDEVQGL